MMMYRYNFLLYDASNMTSWYYLYLIIMMITTTTCISSFSIHPNNNNHYDRVTHYTQGKTIEQQQQYDSYALIKTAKSSALFTTSTNNDNNPIIIDQVETLLKDKYPSFYSLVRSSSSSSSSNNKDLISNIFNNNDMTIFVPNEDAFNSLGKKRIQQLQDPRNDEIVTKICNYHIVNEVALNPSQLWIEDWTADKEIKKTNNNNNNKLRPIKYSGLQTIGGVIPIERRLRSELTTLIQQQKTDENDSDKWKDMIMNPIKKYFLNNDNNDDSNNNNNNDYVMTIGPTAQIIKSWKLSTASASDSNDNAITTTIIIHEIDSLISPEILWRYCNQLTMF